MRRQSAIHGSRAGARWAGRAIGIMACAAMMVAGCGGADTEADGDKGSKAAQPAVGRAELQELDTVLAAVRQMTDSGKVLAGDGAIREVNSTWKVGDAVQCAESGREPVRVGDAPNGGAIDTLFGYATDTWVVGFVERDGQDAGWGIGRCVDGSAAVRNIIPTGSADYEPFGLLASDLLLGTPDDDHARKLLDEGLMTDAVTLQLAPDGTVDCAAKQPTDPAPATGSAPAGAVTFIGRITDQVVIGLAESSDGGDVGIVGARCIDAEAGPLRLVALPATVIDDIESLT